MSTHTIETVTPEMAAAWLKLDANKERPIRSSHVQFLADLIRRGEWQFTHQGICFSKTGSLLDGFHRLSAIVVSRLPVEILVSRDMPIETVHAMDFGRPRSIGDMLHLQPNAVAVARMLWSLYHWEFGTTKATVPQLQPILQWSLDTITAIEVATPKGRNRRRNAPGIMAATVACLVHGQDQTIKNWVDYVIDAPGKSEAAHALIQRLATRPETLTNVPMSRWDYAARVWRMLDPKKQDVGRSLIAKVNDIQEISEIQDMRRALFTALYQDRKTREIMWTATTKRQPQLPAKTVTIKPKPDTSNRLRLTP